jgi:RNA polymerase sigma-70 factor (ECF subfamily)
VDSDNQRQERFVRLFSANEAAIRAFVRRLVPARDDANDVMQEVAVALWRKFETPHGGDTEFRRWAFGVARYEVLAWRRDKARDRHVLNEDVLNLLAEDALASEKSLDTQREALSACLEKMAAPQRELVLAAYSESQGIQTAAQRSGRSVRGFYQWLYRIRTALLDCVRRATQEAIP